MAVSLSKRCITRLVVASHLTPSQSLIRRHSIIINPWSKNFFCIFRITDRYKEALECQQTNPLFLLATFVSMHLHQKNNQNQWHWKLNQGSFRCEATFHLVNLLALKIIRAIMKKFNNYTKHLYTLQIYWVRITDNSNQLRRNILTGDIILTTDLQITHKPLILCENNFMRLLGKKKKGMFDWLWN